MSVEIQERRQVEDRGREKWKKQPEEDRLSDDLVKHNYH